MEETSQSHKLPPISDLFSQSWETFKKSFLNLLLLNIMSIAVYAVIVILAVIYFAIFGFSAYLSHPTDVFSGILTNPLIIGSAIIGILTLIITCTIIGLAFQIAMLRIIYHQEKPESLIKLVKNSLPLVWPLFFTSVISGFLILGGFSLAIIPGLLFIIFFSFTNYEVIFNHKRGIEALGRSFALITNNFWPIIGRMLLLFLIYGVVYAIIPKNGGEGGGLMFVVNTLLSWLGLIYGVTLYKQASHSNAHLAPKSIKVIVLISVVGLALLAAMLYFGTAAILKYKNNFPYPAQYDMTGSNQYPDQNMMAPDQMQMTHPDFNSTYQN